MSIQEAGTPPAPLRTRRRFLPQLEGARGLAAVGVLTTHVAFSSGQIRWNEAPGFEQAGNGVWAVLLQQLSVSLPIFFTLSGLLLYRPFALSTIAGTRRPELGPYLWRRALRTLPAYWALVVVALITLNAGSVTSVWEVVRPLLLLQIYDSGAHAAGRGIEQTWSLCTEIAFYFLLPLLAWGLHVAARRGADPVARTRRILAILVVPFVVSLGYTVWVHTPPFAYWPIQHSWAPKWVGFIAIGMALAALSAAAEVADRPVLRAYELVRRAPLASWGVALAVYAALCLSPVGDPGSANYPLPAQAVVEVLGYMLFGLFAVAPLTLTGGGSRFIDRVLTNPVSLFLGRISYGVYLWHIALIYWINGSMFGYPSFLQLQVLVLAGSVAIATVSYYLLERPAMTLRERLGKATATPSVETVEVPARP